MKKYPLVQWEKNLPIFNYRQMFEGQTFASKKRIKFCTSHFIFFNVGPLSFGVFIGHIFRLFHHIFLNLSFWRCNAPKFETAIFHIPLFLQFCIFWSSRLVKVLMVSHFIPPVVLYSYSVLRSEILVLRPFCSTDSKRNTTCKHRLNSTSAK